MRELEDAAKCKDERRSLVIVSVTQLGTDQAKIPRCARDDNAELLREVFA
jgi:hypothetical protein